MSRALQIAEFVVFVALLLVYLNVAGRVFASGGIHPKWWQQQVLIVSAIISLFAFLYLLSGLFSPGLLFIYLVGYEFAFVLSLVFVLFLGPAPAGWLENVTWVNYRLSRIYPWPVFLVMAVQYISLIAYPIVAGVIVFTHARESPDLATLILRVTLVLLILGGSLFAVLSMALALGNEDLDERVRLRVLVSLAGGMLGSYVLNVAVAQWAFGLSGPGVQLGVLTISTEVLVATIGLFALTVVVPYLIGSQRGKAWNVMLLQRRRDRIDELLDIIDLPTADEYSPKLTKLTNELAKETGELRHGVSLPTENDVPGIFKRMAVSVRDAYEPSRAIDTRLRYIDWLDELAANVNRMLADFATAKDPADLSEPATRWAEPYRRRQSEIGGEIEQAEKRKTGLAVAAGLLFTPAVLGVIANSLGHSFWSEFVRALAH